MCYNFVATASLLPNIPVACDLLATVAPWRGPARAASSARMPRSHALRRGLEGNFLHISSYFFRNFTFSFFHLISSSFFRWVGPSCKELTFNMAQSGKKRSLVLPLAFRIPKVWFGRDNCFASQWPTERCNSLRHDSFLLLFSVLKKKKKTTFLQI